MKKRISERAADAWGVPKDVIMNIPRLTISGDKEIYIENHKGILEYTDTEIRISTAMGIVRVCGKNLVIDRIRLEDIVISGCFSRVEYEI
ncbi:MAG: sporulation protein YqfC [Hominilimicola sp.]|nr:sporulation protein YqfC [Clostridia bacterium]